MVGELGVAGLWTSVLSSEGLGGVYRYLGVLPVSLSGP